LGSGSDFSPVFDHLAGWLEQARLVPASWPLIIGLAAFIRALRPVLGDRLGAPRDDLPSSRLTGYDLLDAVGRLTDTTFAIARLFFSGQLTGFPGVTLVVSHGGDACPTRSPRCAATGRSMPRSARRLSTALFRHRVVRSEGVAFLCDVVGADKVVLGSDYPFPIGGPERWRIVDKTSLTEPERRAILGETAARIYRLRLPRRSVRLLTNALTAKRPTECSKNFVWRSVASA